MCPTDYYPRAFSTSLRERLAFNNPLSYEISNANVYKRTQGLYSYVRLSPRFILRVYDGKEFTSSETLSPTGGRNTCYNNSEHSLIGLQLQLVNCWRIIKVSIATKKIASSISVMPPETYYRGSSLSKSLPGILLYFVHLLTNAICSPSYNPDKIPASFYPPFS